MKKNTLFSWYFTVIIFLLFLSCKDKIKENNQPLGEVTIIHLDSLMEANLLLHLGEEPPCSGSLDYWGSLACMRRQASSFTSSMITAVRGIKKMIPMMPKSFPPIIAATRVYSGESPTDFPTTRG